MSSVSKNWPFLAEAWKYALVLTGKESEATVLVSEALKALSTRGDLWDAHRARRLLFAALYRQGLKRPRVTTPESPVENQVLPFHELDEPGRSALTLLYLGLFSSEHLAALLSQSESELSALLSRTRVTLAQKLSLVT